MPKRSSSARPPADPVDSAFANLQHVIDATEGSSPDELRRLRGRVLELERLCDELRAFAKVSNLPDRVLRALDHAAAGEPVGPSLLPIRSEDLTHVPDAVALGRRGGLKGGDARAKALSPRKRREIALKAAAARWSDRKAK